MSTLRSIISYDLGCHRHLISSHRRLQSSVRNQYQVLALSVPKSKDGFIFLAKNRSQLSLLSNRPVSESKSSPKMDVAVYCASVPPTPPSIPWKSWVLGALILAIIPFCKKKWGSLLSIKEVDKVLEETETVADVVEKVAEEVEKVAEKIAEEIPEGGKAGDDVRLIEDIAKKAANDAKIIEDIIQKVEEVDHEVEKDTGSVIAPIMDKENMAPKEKTNKSKL